LLRGDGCRALVRAAWRWLAEALASWRWLTWPTLGWLPGSAGRRLVEPFTSLRLALLWRWLLLSTRRRTLLRAALLAGRRSGRTPLFGPALLFFALAPLFLGFRIGRRRRTTLGNHDLGVRRRQAHRRHDGGQGRGGETELQGVFHSHHPRICRCRPTLKRSTARIGER
jgi:hypothetical protein